MLGRLTWTILKIVSYLVIKGHKRLMAFTNLILISGLDYKRNGVLGEMFGRGRCFPFLSCDWKKFVEEKTFQNSFKKKEECEGKIEI